MGLRESLTVNQSQSMTDIVVGIISLLLIVYLLYTIIRPEKF